jgi:type IV secretory pathway TrbD component
MSDAERGQWHRALKVIGGVAALALGVGLCDWIAGQRGLWAVLLGVALLTARLVASYFAIRAFAWMRRSSPN